MCISNRVHRQLSGGCVVRGVLNAALLRVIILTHHKQTEKDCLGGQDGIPSVTRTEWIASQSGRLLANATVLALNVLLQAC